MKVIDGGFGKEEEKEDKGPTTLDEHFKSMSEIVGSFECSAVALVAHTPEGIMVMGMPSECSDVAWLLDKGKLALLASGE